jgi:hypothetical protein
MTERREYNLPDKLIIFDYSGTLSLEAVAFSSPDNLMSHLESSGLFALGVDNADLFWSIVNTTWQKGSTTSLGYKGVMQASITELFPEKAAANQSDISLAVANFVDAYFDHSLIDEHWRVILEKLSADKSVKVLIATDHYAEATDAVITYLGKWGIEAVPIAADCLSNFVVANSADIGMYKNEQQFWQVVKNVLQLNYKRILLIDDFGQNEQQGDNYRDACKIDSLRKKTIEMLYEVFNADVELFFFDARDKQQNLLITEAAQTIAQFLSN